MTHYKVKALVEIEYDAIRSDKTSSAWEEAESPLHFQDLNSYHLANLKK